MSASVRIAIAACVLAACSSVDRTAPSSSGSSQGPSGGPSTGAPDGGARAETPPADSSPPPANACAGRAAGIYCGHDLDLSKDDRFRCEGGRPPLVVESCAEGCAVGACFRASCAGRGNGAYCGSDAVQGNPAFLYQCAGGAVASFTACGAAGCTTEARGVDDHCGAAPPADVRAAAGNGWVEVRWSAAPGASGFVISGSNGTATHVAGAARSAHVPMPNGTAVTFTVAPDGGAPSAPTPSVTPSLDANVVLDVLHHKQMRNLTCEEASLVTVLSHANITKTEQDVLDVTGIDLTPATFDAQGRLHWGDPYATFVGNPDGLETAYTGYGTYAPPIARAARTFGATVLASGENVAASALYAAIVAGHPAVVWVTSDWSVPTASTPWITPSGTAIAWHGPHEHAVALVGVDGDAVVLDNPLQAREWQRIPRATFEAAYAVYGSMAVILQ